MRAYIAAFAAATVTLTVASPASAATAPPKNKQFRCVVAAAVKPPIPGVILDVNGPGTRFYGAAGKFVLGGRKLKTTDAFRTASVSKTMTAATALKLVEQGRLKLSDPISKYLDAQLVKDLPYGSQITVGQLLNHTAGIYDYVKNQEWFEYVLEHPHKTWNPRELVYWAINKGKPYFKPGEGYAYSDTGYALAGFVIEQVTQMPLFRAYRKLLLDPLGMRRTYLEWWEASRGPMSHPYIGSVDTHGFNPTFDTFGGGGLVATGADLTRFMRGLFGGKVFRHPATLRTMLTTSPQSKHRYAYGIERLNLSGKAIWGHSGFFGAFQYYEPKKRISVTGTLNQAEADQGPLIKNAFTVAFGQRVPGC